MPDNTEYNLRARKNEEGCETTSDKRPCLVMIRGDFIGEVFELASDVTMIGRSDEVDLVISDTSISRRHAMIVKRVDGFHVSDLGSTNGTFINASPVTSAAPLAEGDKLSLGAVRFKFTFQDEDDTEYHQQLRNMAVKDSLTRVYNKGYFLDSLAKEYDFNSRNRTGLSIVMFDIDHFKKVNDTWGHPAGDEILKELARLVETEARGYDLFARYGGEEFVFLMRGASLQAALGLAERVRQSVAKHQFEYDGTLLNITISIGVSYWDGSETVDSAEEIVRRVDHHLYEAKHGGRNRVCH